MNLAEVKNRTERSICSIGCYKDLEFLIAKIERMQKAILEQVNIEQLEPQPNEVWFSIADLQDFFDVEVKNE